MMCLMCESIVEAYCFIQPDIKLWNTAWCVHDSGAAVVYVWVEALKRSNKMRSIDTYLFTPYYSDWIWCAKMDTTILTQSIWYKTSWNTWWGLNDSRHVFPQWWVPRMSTRERLNTNFYFLKGRNLCGSHQYMSQP